jgi:hypothetical protein
LHKNALKKQLSGWGKSVGMEVEMDGEKRKLLNGELVNQQEE